MGTDKKFFAFSQPIEKFFAFGNELHIAWKDTNSNFLGCRELTEKMAGMTRSDIVGLNDKDMLWRDRAFSYLQDEKAVLESRKTKCVYESATIKQGEKDLLTFKTPMISSSGIISGIFQISFILEHYAMFKLVEFVNRLDILNCSPKLLPLPNYSVIRQLTKREQECFFHLVRGRSCKKIARLLICSPRTVEKHIDNIKIKLRCSTRAQLIDKYLQ
jgi:DNA-binding CsgD family transcriptional regulator